VYLSEELDEEFKAKIKAEIDENWAITQAEAEIGCQFK
jgi:hypothetical protein